MFGKNEVEIDVTPVVKNIRDIESFLKTLKNNYSESGKKLKHNCARFKLLKFTIKYILITAILTAVIFLFMLLKNIESLYIAIVLTALWIPYFIFLAIILPIWLLQQTYLIIKTLIITILGVIKKRKVLQ